MGKTDEGDFFFSVVIYEIGVKDEFSIFCTREVAAYDFGFEFAGKFVKSFDTIVEVCMYDRSYVVSSVIDKFDDPFASRILSEVVVVGKITTRDE